MRKFLCIMIIIILLSSYCINLYAANEILENNEEKPKTQLEKLQTENEELQQQIKDKMYEIEIIEDELTKNLLKINEIDNQIEEAEQKLEQLTNDINELNKTIKENENDIKVKQKEYNTQKELTDERLIAICENGQLQYLDVLLGSSNIVEFISNYSLISELYESDIQMLENTYNQKNELEEKSKKLEKQKESITSKRKVQQVDAQVLENTKKSRQLQISKLTQEEQGIQEQIDEYKTQVSAIEKEIVALSMTKIFGEDYVGEKMIWPIPGHTNITSKFGMRVHPITGTYSLHTGTDVSAEIGTDFLAMASGVVVKADYNYAYGNMVIIDHGGGVQTLYAHGSQILVKLGQEITQGDPVLKVGTTGYSTGPHAHFEIRINGVHVNPTDYVEPK